MQATMTHQGGRMTRSDFNQEATSPQYTYRKSPVHPHGFQILRYPNGMGSDPVPVGEYTVLDLNEAPELSEKKVMNLIALLNGRKALMQLGHETKTRVLYHVVSEEDEDGKFRVLFYHLGQGGVSVENALFRIERDEHVH